MLVNHKLGRIWREAAVTFFNILAVELRRGTKESDNKLQL
jgi:hypothetical protein